MASQWKGHLKQEKVSSSIVLENREKWQTQTQWLVCTSCARLNLFMRHLPTGVTLAYDCFLSVKHRLQTAFEADWPSSRPGLCHSIWLCYFLNCHKTQFPSVSNRDNILPYLRIYKRSKDNKCKTLSLVYCTFYVFGK